MITDFVTENFDLTVGPVDWQRVFSKFIKSIDLNVQRKSFDSFLIAKICAQTLNSDVEFGRSFQGIPIERDCVVGHFFDRTNDASRIFSICIKNALFDRMLPGMPKLPCFDLLFMCFLFSKN